MMLVRRVGPLVQGICLDRDSSNSVYFPKLFVHCLCLPFPGLSLSLGQPLRSVRSGTVERISGGRHEELYRGMCARLMGSSLLPAQGDWQLPEVLDAYERFYRIGKIGSLYPVKLMEDAVSVCAWLGNVKEAASVAARYIEEARNWSEDILARDGGFVAWKKKLENIATSGEGLREVVNYQVEALKLQKIPFSNLLP